MYVDSMINSLGRKRTHWNLGFANKLRLHVHCLCSDHTATFLHSVMNLKSNCLHMHGLIVCIWSNKGLPNYICCARSRLLVCSLFFSQTTDICSDALGLLAESKIKRVIMAGYKGPLDVDFSIKQFREMINLPGCRTVLNPEDFYSCEPLLKGLHHNVQPTIFVIQVHWVQMPLLFVIQMIHTSKLEK